jgi:hypothetical protein
LISPEIDEISLNLTISTPFLTIQSRLGNKWAEVARQIPGKTGQQCAQRWRHRVNPDIRREKWGAEEDATLAALVQKHGNSWAVIARSMPGRTDQQCMGRWKRHLDPSIRRESWTPQEDATLFQLAEEYENAWSAVSRGLTGRTPQQCRTRWHYISGNPNAAEASRAAIQAMRDAQAAAEAAKSGLKKRRGRPSKNALAAAAAGMLTVLAPLPKGTVMYQPHHYDHPSEEDADGAVAPAAPPATVGVKRAAPARRPGRPPRKKVPAVEDVDYFESNAATAAGGVGGVDVNGRYNNTTSNQFDTTVDYQNTTTDTHRGSIDGEEATLLDGFWHAVAAAPPPSNQLEIAERRASGAVATGRRNRPTRARIPSRRRTSFSMSSEDEGSDDDDEEEEERYEDEGDEDFIVKEKRTYHQQQQQQQQRQHIWRPEQPNNDDNNAAVPLKNTNPNATTATAPGGGGGSDFEGADDTDNEADFDRQDDDEYVPEHAGGIRTHPINQQQHPGARSPSVKQVMYQQAQQAGAPTTAATAAAGTHDAHGTANQQQQYFEEPALLLGSSRAERRVSLGDVPLSPAVFSPALTPPWSRRKRQNHARLAAFGPSVPTTTGGAANGGATSNTHATADGAQHGTPRRQHHHHSGGTGAAAALQAGAPLASPGILDLLNSPESFHHQRRRSSGGNGGVGDDHHNDHGLGGHGNDDRAGGVGPHRHQDTTNDEDFFPGVFPESPALPQFAGLITPEWARAAAAASAAAEDAEVRRLSIASVARRLDVDSVAVAVAVNGTGESPPQAGSLSVSLSLSAGGIPPAAGRATAAILHSRAAGGAGAAAAITPAAAAAIVATPGIDHTSFFSPVEQHTARAAPSSALPPYSTTTTTNAVPPSASHGRTFLAAALQRTVGSGLMPPPGAFFPTTNAPTLAPGEMMATPMAIEDLLLTPMGVHIAGSNVPQVVLTAAPTGGAILPMVETMPSTTTNNAVVDDGVVASLQPADISAALQQAGLVALPAGQYNRVVLQNTTLTARKDAPTTTAAASTVAAPLSSNDVRMKLQALLEQV